jgi:hypothetical protein
MLEAFADDSSERHLFNYDGMHDGKYHYSSYVTDDMQPFANMYPYDMGFLAH